MKKVLVVMFAMAVMAVIFGFKQAEAQTSAPVAGGEVSRWSARKQILGRDVYNDKNEKVGNSSHLSESFFRKGSSSSETGAI